MLRDFIYAYGIFLLFSLSSFAANIYVFSSFRRWDPVQEEETASPQALLLHVPPILGRVDLHDHRLPRGLHPHVSPGKVRTNCTFGRLLLILLCQESRHWINVSLRR